MNREKHQVAVVDTAKMQLVDNIDVGGTTETASTTADGKWIVAAVSSANRVVVIDAVTHQIVKSFENVGNYPWSVTIPRGQNYCH
jgi:DNA-binding beta-propeller fold protein YncE